MPPAHLGVKRAVAALLRCCESSSGMPEGMSAISQEPDFPRMAVERGRIEPAPRRVRGFVGSQLVFDTTRARYVWEVPYYPQYYIPLADVRAELPEG